MPEDKTLLKKIHERKLIDEELEEDLNFIVRRNRMLQYHPPPTTTITTTTTTNERPSKKRRKNIVVNVDDEATCEKKYKVLRRGELIEDMDNKPLTYLCNEYAKYSRFALGLGKK